MCWNLCTYVNIMLELVDQSKKDPLSVNLLIRIPVSRNSWEKKTWWDFQGNYGVQWVQISTKSIKYCYVWLSIKEDRMGNWHSNACHLPLHQGLPMHRHPPVYHPEVHVSVILLILQFLMSKFNFWNSNFQNSNFQISNFQIILIAPWFSNNCKSFIFFLPSLGFRVTKNLVFK